MVAGDKHQLLELEELLYVLAEREWTETQTESGLDLAFSRRWWIPERLKPGALLPGTVSHGPLGLEQHTDHGTPECPPSCPRRTHSLPFPSW